MSSMVGLSGLEYIMVVKFIQTHLDGLSPDEPDHAPLTAALFKLGKQHMEPAECLCLLRHMRIARDELWNTMLAAEERQRGGHNGALIELRLVLDGQLCVLDEIIRKLWACVLA